MSDEQLQAVIVTAGEIIEGRKASRRAEAIETAREALAIVGLTLQEAARPESGRAGR